MTDYKIIGIFKHWNVLNCIPEGWVIDRNAGSPLHGHVFITNGKNILSGEQIRVLAPAPREKQPPLTPVNLQDICPQFFPEPQPEAEKPNRQIDEECRRVLNDLARKKVQEKLLQDIIFDMNVCKLEGWDHREYLFELENLIDRLIIDSLKEERESGQ